MAGTSIARLAVVIVGDDGQLSVTLRNSAASIRAFHGHNASLLHQIKGGHGVMHLMEGRIGGLGHALRLLSSPGGAILGTAAAFGFLAFKMAEAGDKAAEARIKIQEEYGKAFEAATGKKAAVSFGATSSNSGQLKEMKENLSGLLATTGENVGITGGLFSLYQRISESAAALNYDLKTSAQHARDAQVEVLLKDTEYWKRVAAFSEETKKTTAKVMDERKRQAEQDAQEMAARAEEVSRRIQQISESLRTPDEVFRERISELKAFAAQGVLSAELYARGIAKARDELDSATKSARGFHSETASRVGAVERHTAAGFSAVQSGKAELARIEAVEKQQLVVQKEQVKKQEEIRQAIVKFEPVRFTPSNL